MPPEELELNLGVGGDEPAPRPPAAPPAKEGSNGKAPKQPDELAELRKQFDALRKQNEELAASERYWAEQARGRGKPEPDPEEEPEEPEDDDPELTDDTPDKLVDDFSTKGVEALVKRGVLTKKAAREIIRKEAEKVARQIVDTRVRQVTEDSKLMTEFPELNDPESELYKATQKIYRGLVAEDPALRKSVGALKMAARQAKLELKIQARANGRGDEDERVNRIKAQNGDRGDRYSGGFEDDGDSLPPQAAEIMAAFAQVGVKDLDEDHFREQMRRGRENGRRGRR